MLARWLYSLIFYAAIPLLLWRLKKRTKKNPGYAKRVGERFALYPKAQGCSESLWFHTVSVGEFIAAKPLIDRFLSQYPNRTVVITTMTPTGSDQVKNAYPKELAENRVLHVYLPYDLPDAIGRFLKRFNPKVLVILETELWPNLIHCTARAKIPIVVANARLSERSAAGYQRVLPLIRPMMKSISLIAAQSAVDGERFVELGLPKANLRVTGTVKFDLSVNPDVFERASRLRQLWGKQRSIFIAASTHEGEDEKVIDAFFYIRDKVKSALLVVVPRHPERFEDVAILLKKRGLHFARFSTQEPVNETHEVVLGDTMGDLLVMLGAADVAFIGGSFEPVGGHNMLEALAMGTPALTGPHVFNFKMVADLLTEWEVLTTVSSAVGLGDAVIELLLDHAKREQLADAGKAVVASNRGVVDRLFALVSQQARLDC